MRVLLVEDDELIRETVADILTDAGHEVLQAATGEEAVDHCQDRDPDLVFTDIRLPGSLDGWDVAEHCRSSNPEVPVIYATGFSHVSSRSVPRSITFQKPYRPQQLLDAIQSLNRH